MIDMLRTIQAKSDQLNAMDLGTARKLLRITRVQEVNSDEQPIAIHYEGGDGRPYKPSKGMRRALVFIWGEDGSDYAGRTLEVYNDPDVTWGGEKIGGIRISRASHISEAVTFPLQLSKAKRILYTVDPLPADAPRKAARSLDDMVDGYIAHVDAAEDLEALMLVTGGEDAGKLRTRIEQRAGDQKDRLLGRMTQAGSARAAALSGEGPVDSQRGETTGEDDDRFPGDE